MRLSQSNLKQLKACPRKFQYLYIDQYAVPVSLEQVERMAEGSQFHLLMQQHSFGLPISALLASDPRLKTWFDSFGQQREKILRLDEHEQILWQQSEHLRTLEQQGHIITVVYDWVMLGATQGQIIDWKTYPKPRQAKRLEQNWQTRLYLYVLAETTNIVPEQLVMTYWFFQSPTAETAKTQPETAAPAQPPPAQSVRIRYSSEQHATTQDELNALLSNLSQWLTDYTKTEVEFPQVDLSQGHCTSCAFARRCDRHKQELEGSTPISLDQIAEVPI